MTNSDNGVDGISLQTDRQTVSPSLRVGGSESVAYHTNQVNSHNGYAMTTAL